MEFCLLGDWSSEGDGYFEYPMGTRLQKLLILMVLKATVILTCYFKLLAKPAQLRSNANRTHFRDVFQIRECVAPDNLSGRVSPFLSFCSLFFFVRSFCCCCCCFLFSFYDKWKFYSVVFLLRSSGSPSFGALASQTGVPSFGALAGQSSSQVGFGGLQPQQQQSTPSFGSFGGSPQWVTSFYWMIFYNLTTNYRALLRSLYLCQCCLLQKSQWFLFLALAMKMWYF